MYNDNGFKSRKMIMSYVVLFLGTIGFLVTGYWPALAVVYPEYCVFLIAASGVYVSGNAAIKWMATRTKPVTLTEENRQDSQG